MPISHITNGQDAELARGSLNNVIDAVNALGTAANAQTTDFATAAEGSLAATAVQPGDLGNSAGLNVGTTADTVAAGNDSRFSDARPPTGAAGGILSGTYPNPGYATGTQAFTDADHTKLDGIEANADVTDAANVASAINGADGVTTLSDTDKIALTVGGVLKTIVYSALKTLLDAIYVKSGGALGTPSSGTLTNCNGLPTAGLVNNAVTLAKMATGTAGNLITYDASGNPAAVSTGNAGQVLTSNGAGAAPTFQDATGGGGGGTGTVVWMDLVTKRDTQALGVEAWQPVAGLSITRTLASASNEVIVEAVINGSSGGNNLIAIRLTRNGTAIGDSTSATPPQLNASAATIVIAANSMASLVAKFKDAPGTVGPHTYAVEFRMASGAGGAAYLGRPFDTPAQDYCIFGTCTLEITERKA